MRMMSSTLRVSAGASWAVTFSIPNNVLYIHVKLQPSRGALFSMFFATCHMLDVDCLQACVVVQTVSQPYVFLDRRGYEWFVNSR